MTLIEKVKELCDSVMDFVGLKESEFESESDASKHTASNATADFTQYKYPSFSEELGYEYYDAQSQLFLNQHNAGIIYRLTPLTGANEVVAEQLDSIIRNKIGENFSIQVIQIKHNQVGPKIDRFSDQFEQKGLSNLSLMGKSLESYYKRAAKKGFKTRNGIRTRLTSTEVYLIVDCASHKQSEKALKLKFDKFRVPFQAALSASKIGFQICDAVDFVHLMCFFTRHNIDNIYPEIVDYDESKLLKHQLTDRSFELLVNEDTKDHLILSGRSQNQDYETAISVLTLDKMPTSFQIWNNINNASNIFNSEYDIGCNHIISVIYKLDNHSRAQARASLKSRDLEKKSKSDYASFVSGTEEQARQWKAFKDDLTQKKTSSCKMLFNVILFSDKKNRVSDVEDAMNAFAFNGLNLSVCKRMQVPYFTVSMPFMFSDNLQYDFSLPQMMHHISSWNAIQYLPILSDWHGQEKGILMPSSRGQISLIEQFSDYFGTNFNVNVTGMTGSGKSFLLQMMVLSTLFDGGNVYIIDIGGSYRKLCEAVGGIYLEYENLAMNPFTHIDDMNKHISSITDLFSMLVSPDGDIKVESKTLRATLRAAILKSFSEKGNKTLIDDVQASLIEIYDVLTHPMGMQLAERLAPYNSKAEHGKAFNEASKLDPKARFIVVDLLALKEMKEVLSPVLLAVFNQYRKSIFQSDRSIKKLCLVDEAWEFFAGNPTAISFLASGFRTGRRHFASFCVITQGIADYFNFPEAKPLWDSAAMKLVLLQDETALKSFNKDHDFLSDYEMEVLKKFPEAKSAGYSQVLIKAGKIRSFHRLFVDPFTLVLLSSDGRDYEAVRKLKANGMPFLESVDRVAHAHYGDMYD